MSETTTTQDAGAAQAQDPPPAPSEAPAETTIGQASADPADDNSTDVRKEPSAYKAVDGLQPVSGFFDSFTVWHWRTDLTGSDALVAVDLDRALPDIKHGDVVYVHACDGVLHRAVYIVNGSVQLRHVA